MSSPFTDRRESPHHSSLHGNPASSQFVKDLNNSSLRGSSDSPPRYISSVTQGSSHSSNQFGSSGGSGQFGQGEQHSEKKEQLQWQQLRLDQQQSGRAQGTSKGDYPYQIFVSEEERGIRGEIEADGTLVKTHSFQSVQDQQSSPIPRSPSEIASSGFTNHELARSISGDGQISQDGRVSAGRGIRVGADSVGPSPVSATHRQDFQPQQHDGQHQKSDHEYGDRAGSSGYGEPLERMRERELSSVDSRGFSSVDSQSHGWRESDTSYDSLQSKTESLIHSQQSPLSAGSNRHSSHLDPSRDDLPVEFGQGNFASYHDNGQSQRNQPHDLHAQGYTPQYQHHHHHQHLQQQQQQPQQPPARQNQQHLNQSLYQGLLHSQQPSSMLGNAPQMQQPSSSQFLPQVPAQASPGLSFSQQQQFAQQNLPPSRPESPEFSIFVGDLSPDLREEDLVAQFLNPPPWPPSHPFAIAHAHALQAKGHYGPPPRVAPRPFTSCKSSKIMIDPANRSSRGFGFVRFSTEDDCFRALIEMQGVVMVPANGASPGRPLRVCTATPKNRHANGGAPGMEMQNPPAMSQSVSAGTNLYSGPARPAVLGSGVPSQSPTLPGGHGSQIGSRTGQPAEMLQRAASGGYLPPPLMPLHAASPEQGPLSGPQYGPSSSLNSSTISPLPPGTGLASLVPSSSSFDPSNTTVFVGGLSSLISEDTLKTFFVPFGEITYVKIPPGKGCGFVQFVRKPDAERAIERMQGFPIGGGRIRLSWGRSQGDKAAAAAVTAAQRAAQLGQLAGLAGLSGLTQTQLAQLAGLSKAINAQTVRADPNYPPQAGIGPDPNSALLRQLSAAASGLAESVPSPSQPRSSFPEYANQYGGDGRDDLDADVDLRAAFQGLAFNSGSHSSQIPQTERFETLSGYGERGRSQSHYPFLEQPRRNSPYTLVQSSKFAPFSPQDSPVGNSSNLPHESRGGEDSSSWNQY